MIVTLLKWIKQVVTEEQEFNYWDESVLIALFNILDYKESDEEVKINDYTVESIFTKGKYSKQTSMKKINAVVTETNELSQRVKSETTEQFWSFRTIKILLQWSICCISSQFISYRCKVSFGTMLDGIISPVTEKYDFKNRGKSNLKAL